jgi:chaperonin GroES
MAVYRLAMNSYLGYYRVVSTLMARVLNSVKVTLLITRRRQGMAVKLQPMADRVLVKPTEREEKTKSGIYLPDTVKEKPQEGKVIAVGPGRMTEDGKRVALDVKVGDTVLYARYGGAEIKVDDEELIILREADILAKKAK